MSSRRGYISGSGIIPQDYVLCYDFDNDYQDKSVNALHGIKTGTAVFEDGLKGKKCLKFTSGCVKTPSVLPINSDKVSISLWIKTIQTTVGIIAEMSANTASNNAFYVAVNDSQFANGINFGDHNSQGYNISGAPSILPITNFEHLVIIVDRSLGINQTKIYVNNTDKFIGSIPAYRTDMIGNWVNNILFIGQRNASSIPFVGSLQNLKIYNRVLTRAEILGLSKELL